MVSAVSESMSPLVDEAIPENGSTETVADVSVTGGILPDDVLAVDGALDVVEHNSVERPLIADAVMVEGESVVGDVAELVLPEPEPVTVDAVVRNVLVRDYKWFWSTDETGIVERVVEILEAPPLGDDLLAETAGRVRAVLWSSRHVSGGPSAAATCSIFHALGREGELGWVAREAYLYAMGL